MDSDTDTASDSSQDGTYAHDFLDGCLPASESTTLSGTTQDTETLMSNMCDGINLICGLNLSEVELTPIVHNDIQQASTSISLFLDQIILPSSNVDYYDTIDGFQELCQTEVLERLFELRRVFHAIASREVQKRNAAVVCWVDDLLARLGEAVRRFIEIIDTRSASPRTIEQPLSTLQTWREDLALRAAAQLPHAFPQVITTIASGFASAASARLVIRIMFSSTVLGRAVGMRTHTSSETAHQALRTYICKFSAETSSLVHPSQRLESKVTLAMALSIFAMHDYPKVNEQVSRFRPHTQAIMLGHIERILASEDTETMSMSSLEPMIHLDTAQKLLIQWGMSVPWCWYMWDDERIADHEVIQSLTITWLYHLEDDPAEEDTWERQLERCMSLDPTAAFTALVIVLRRAKDSLMDIVSMPHALSGATLRVLYRCCWGVKVLIGMPGAVQEASIKHSTNVLCSLFILLQKSEQELTLSDCIIAALASVTPHILRGALREVSCDVKSNTKAKLDTSTADLHREIDATSRATPLEDICVQKIRQLLQFVTLVWQADGPLDALFHPQSIPTFLRGLIRRLSAIRNHTPAVKLHQDVQFGEKGLLTPLLICLASAELARRRDPTLETVKKPRDDGLMWELVTDATITDDVLAISALSAYVVAAPQKLDALRCAVIWDMFRDFILLVGQHHFLGMQDECLSLATCPLVLEAMSVLMESKKPNIVPYIISSPWTQSLRKYLCDFAPLIRVEERFRKVVTDTLVPLCMSLAQQIQSHIDCASSNEPEATQQKAMKYTSLSHICYFPSGMGPKLMLSR